MENTLTLEDIELFLESRGNDGLDRLMVQEVLGFEIKKDEI